MTDIVERLLRPGSTIEEREAADEIERLRLETESLRSMLTEIVSVWDDDSTDIIMNTLIREAKEALDYG